MQKQPLYVIGVIVVLVLIVGGFWYTDRRPGELDGFAQCLQEKDAVFYGAFWCPHCQNQKKLFGRSARHLPYVECSTPNGKGQLQVCIDKEIKGYPTWAYADGSRDNGEVTLSRLAEKTGCALPE